MQEHKIRPLYILSSAILVLTVVASGGCCHLNDGLWLSPGPVGSRSQPPTGTFGRTRRRLADVFRQST
jgi:hypothetical protein